MTLTRQMLVGEEVHWYNRKWYCGWVVKVVEPGEDLDYPKYRIRGSRDHVSYLVQVRPDERVLGRVLWPRVNYLQEGKQCTTDVPTVAKSCMAMKTSRVSATHAKH
jgi:hypothetical protein